MRNFLWLLLLFVFVMQASASGKDKDIFTRLEGEWRSNGDAFGRPAVSDMSWTRVLGGRFMRLDYGISSEGKVFFEGTARYRISEGETTEAFWADSSGDLHPIRAAIEENAITAHWGVAGAKQGRSRYQLLTDDEIQVTDWLLTKDGWRQFNQNNFRRILEAQ